MNSFRVSQVLASFAPISDSQLSEEDPACEYSNAISRKCKYKGYIRA